MLDGLTANFLGPVNLTRAVLPYMREQKSGTIIFQSSVAAYFGAPGSGTYGSGKGALEGKLVPNSSISSPPPPPPPLF